MKNVLITSAGRRVTLVRAFQYELKQFAPSAHVYATDARPQLSAACQVAHRAFQTLRVTESGYAEQLKQLCLEHGIQLVVPTIDTELKVLAMHREEFSQAGIEIVVSDLPLIQICRDKRLTNQFFNEHGISTPRLVDRHQPEFPLFIKPYDGSCSQDLYLIRSAQELTEALICNERLMFMEYLPKEDFQEYTLDMYYDRHSTLKCVVPRLRIEVRSGEVNKAITCKNQILPLMYKTFPVMPGARGCITLQLFVHRQTGKTYGIEINPRFGGGYPLSYKAGANFPRKLLLEYFEHQLIVADDEWEEDLLMLRYDHEVFVNAAHVE